MRLLSILLPIVMIGCTVQNAQDIPDEIKILEHLTLVTVDQGPLHDINLDPIVHFGDSEDFFISRFTVIAVDDPGNVYIGDGGTNTVHIFSPDGNYTGSIGREGEGPGEFRSLADIKIYNHWLYVMDTRTYRITKFVLESGDVANIFDIPFEPTFASGTVAIPSGFYLTEADNEIIIRFNNAIMARETDDDIKPVLFGRIFNTYTHTFNEGRVYEFPDNERLIHREASGNLLIISPDYMRSSHIIFANDYFIHVWDEHALFKFYDLNRKYMKAIYLPFDKVKVDKNEIIQIYDDAGEPLRSMVRNDKIPDFYPVLKKTLIDDENRIWAGLFTEQEDKIQWKLISNDGSLIASFEWPHNLNIMKVKNGYVYALETDPETALQILVKYSVSL